MLMIEAAFEAHEPRALDTVAFKQDDGVIVAFDVRDLANGTGAGKSLVDERNAVAGDHVGLLAELFEDHAASEDRPDRVAIGPGMRGNQKALATFDGVQNCVDVVTSLHR